MAAHGLTRERPAVASIEECCTGDKYSLTQEFVDDGIAVSQQHGNQAWAVAELDEGLMQLHAYLDGLGLPSGWLLVFDRRSGRPPIAKRTTAAPATTPVGRTVTLLRA